MADDEEVKYEEVDPEAKGTADPTAKFREMDIPDEEVEQIEKERKERLAEENRPENAEVDNTQREFDPTTGQFKD